MRPTAPADQERREFYRVDDDIIFEYHILDSLHGSSPLNHSEPLLELQKIGNTLKEIDLVHQTTLHEISLRNPNIAEYLRAINKKIEVFSNFLAQDFLAKFLFKADEKPVQRVNLSAGGVGFAAQESIAEGRYVRCKLVLQPHYDCVLVTGEVVHCKQQTEENADPSYRISLKFVDLNHHNEQIITRYIFQKQVAMRKKGD